MRTGKRACEADVEEDGAVIEEVLKKPKGEEYVISSSSGVLAEEYNRRPPMNYEVANGKNSMEIDEDLHSRQLAVYGRETMRRLFASSVLVSGLQGLGAEIGKLSLMGSLKAKSTKKEMGNFKFAGKASQRQTYLKTGADFHPVYSELLEGINDKLLNSESNANRPDIVNKVVYDLLQHGEEWNKFRRTSLKKKIDHCILLDNFVPDVGVSMDARAKALQSHSKRSQKHMSRQQHRKYGSFDMPKEFHKFELFKPMHDMWKVYILELLEESRKKHLAQCLLTADLHGAFVVVVECKTRSFVGISGIMIRETTETFGIIKQDNHFRGLKAHPCIPRSTLPFLGIFLNEFRSCGYGAINVSHEHLSNNKRLRLTHKGK